LQNLIRFLKIDSKIVILHCGEKLRFGFWITCRLCLKLEFKSWNVEEAVEIQSYSTGFLFRTNKIPFIGLFENVLNSINVWIMELAVKFETISRKWMQQLNEELLWNWPETALKQQVQ